MLNRRFCFEAAIKAAWQVHERLRGMLEGRMTTTLLQGDCREVLAGLPEQSIQTCVTSPPYWQQRRYTDSPDEIGQEPTYQAYVETLASVFDGVWRVLRDDGTLWLNLGDAYANDTKWGGKSGAKNYTSAGGNYGGQRNKRATGLPPKSLIGLPWRVAFVLQERGWVLRNDIVWWKPNAMPEGGKNADRCDRDHEYVFLFSKQSEYFSDIAALAEPAIYQEKRIGRVGLYQNKAMLGEDRGRQRQATRDLSTRRVRTIWRINTQGLPDEHYAPYPDELPRRCILAGSRSGDTVLDPFVGSGTTCRVAESLGRNSIGIDLGYQELQEKRTDGVQIRMEAYLT